MAQIAKIEAKEDIKCSSAKFYDFLKYDINKFTNMFPQIFKSAQLVEGEEGQAGNVKFFEYVIGKALTAKLYTSFKAKVTVSDGTVTWCLEFEKANDLAPNPDQYAAVAVEVTKGLDFYLLTNI
ncbi:hypothetical protein DH2020_037689 [Rehmannia glutinosa]|uniref:Bet v I/Major latex protein domain-containing protein n=1 Tax=Rehmannia glutinosa TaxID=99300 RepID=A0ABR0V3C4_REHGL